MTHLGTDTNGPGRRRRDPQATRDRLVRAALTLFTTKGYHASTTPQIAAAAGVAEGTIYRHFQSKEQLLNELYRAAVRLLGTHLEQVPRSAPCPDQLQHVAAAWRGVATRDPGVIRLVFLTRHGDLMEPRSRDAMRQLKAELGRIVASGKAAGTVRTGSAGVWVEVWLALVVMALERVADGDWPDQHTGPTQVFEAAWDALRAPDARSESTPGTAGEPGDAAAPLS